MVVTAKMPASQPSVSLAGKYVQTPATSTSARTKLEYSPKFVARYSNRVISPSMRSLMSGRPGSDGRKEAEVVVMRLKETTAPTPLAKEFSPRSMAQFHHVARK